MPGHDPLPPAARQRSQMRETTLADRLAQTAETIAGWTARLQVHLLDQWPSAPGRVVGFCWPVQNEADLRPVLAEWALRARPAPVTAALPVVVAPGQALAFRPWHAGAAMVTDRYGIPTPADGDFLAPDVLLIPLNAFDANGYRIGYGGGFFDRTLATLTPRPLAIGVGFEIGRVADTQPQAYDQRLDWLVTERGVWKP